MGRGTQGEKAKIVQKLRKEGHALKDLLKAIGLSRSTYYYEISKTDRVQERSADLSTEIAAVFAEHKGRYGVRRVYRELVNRGWKVNHKCVQRIMHQLCLAGIRPKEKYHSYKGEVGKVADNIINRDFSTTKPLEKWTTDVSQFNLSWGKCYISPILDMNTNEVISYNLSQSPNMAQVTDMLQKAFERFPVVKGLVFHSDQGCSTSMPHIVKSFEITELHSPCPEKEIAMITVSWRHSLAGSRTKCSTATRRNFHPLSPSLMPDKVQ